MFDLSTLNTATEATFDLELTHPNTLEPLGLFITHKCVTAPDVQAFTRRRINEDLRKEFKARRTNKEEAPTVEEGVKRSAELLAAATTAWWTMEKGKRVEGFKFGSECKTFTPDAAEQLYSDPGFRWLRDQLDESVGDVGRFLPK